MINFTWIEKNIKGALYVGEGVFLFQLAKRCEGRGVIVEIGSLLGKSTAYLALGSKANSNAKVFAIDTFNGGNSKPKSELVKNIFAKGDFFEDFLKNMEKANMTDIVVPIRMRSEDAIDEIDEPIELLFINGAHDYKNVEKDFLTYFPKVIERGTIAFHDMKRTGVREFIHDKILTHDKLYTEASFRSILVCRRLRYGRIS